MSEEETAGKLPFRHELAEPRPKQEVDQAYEVVNAHHRRFFDTQGIDDGPLPLEAWKTIINDGDEQSMARALSLGGWHPGDMAEFLFHAHLKEVDTGQNFQDLGINPYLEENRRGFSQIWTWLVGRASKRAAEERMEMTVELDIVLAAVDNSRKHVKSAGEKETSERATQNLPETNFARTEALLAKDSRQWALNKALKLNNSAWTRSVFQHSAALCVTPVTKRVRKVIGRPDVALALVKNRKFSKEIANELHKEIILGVTLKEGAWRKYGETALILKRGGFDPDLVGIERILKLFADHTARHVKEMVAKMEAYATIPQIQAALIQSENTEVLASVALFLDPKGWLSIARRIYEKGQAEGSLARRHDRELAGMLNRTRPEMLEGLTSGDISWLVGHDDESVRAPARALAVALAVALPPGPGQPTAKSARRAL